MDYLTTATGYVRWDPARFIGYRNGTYDPLNSYLLDQLKTLPVAGIYKVLDDANRPDMISYAIYKDLQYWWLLLIYNNQLTYAKGTRYLSIPSGTTLNYFSIDDLERLYFSLRAAEKANSTSS